MRVWTIPPLGTSKGDTSYFGLDDDKIHRVNSSSSVLTQQHPPHNTTFDLHGNSTAAQMDLISQLLSSLYLPWPSGLAAKDVHRTLKDSFVMVRTTTDEYIQMVKVREEWWKAQLQRVRERQTVWEECSQTVVKEGEVLERELPMRSRKRGRLFNVCTSDRGGAALRQNTH
jgi:hypothetical protein